MQLDSQKHSIFKNYDHTASEMFSILDFQGNVLNREFANEFKEKDLLKIYSWLVHFQWFGKHALQNQ